MPVFIRPARVVVDQGGSGLAAALLVGVVAGAVTVVSSVAAALTQAAWAILAALLGLCVVGIAGFVVLARRGRSWLYVAPRRGTLPAGRSAQGVGGRSAPRAIEPLYVVIDGVEVDAEDPLSRK